MGAARARVPVYCWSLAYLTTGVLVSVLGQQVASSPGIDPALHVIPAAKWMSTLLVSLLAHVRSVDDQSLEVRPGVGTRAKYQVNFKVRAMTVLLGLLDCAAYMLFCLGFERCGAAATAVVLPAMGHILTAFFSVTLLRNPLSKRRAGAVMLVFLGVMTKGWDVEFSADGDVRAGFWYLGLASLCYSSMGVVYESIVRLGSAPRHATITLYSSCIGTLSYVSYIVFSGRARHGWGALNIAAWSWARAIDRFMGLVSTTWSSTGSTLYQGLKWASGIPSWAWWLAMFALLYNVHVYVQGMTFRSDGALGVQVVNAVRGCTTNMVFYLLDALSEKRRGSSTVGLFSGMLAGAGGLLWIEIEQAASRKATDKED